MVEAGTEFDGHIGDIINAWSSRMTMQHDTDIVYDQVLQEWVTWQEGLWRISHESSSLTKIGYPFSNNDVIYAAGWETAGVPEKHGWPLFLLTPKMLSMHHCQIEDHRWEISFDAHDRPSLICIDPCPKDKVVPFITYDFHAERAHKFFNQGSASWFYRGTAYFEWNPCTYEGSTKIEEALYGCFEVRLTTNTDAPASPDGVYAIEMEAVFDPTSIVCTKCGCEVKPPRMARSIDGSQPLCPYCGRKDRELKLNLEVRDGTTSSDAGKPSTEEVPAHSG
jgi:hypothetical protein